MKAGYKTKEQIDYLIVSICEEITQIGKLYKTTKGKLEKATLEMEVKNRIATINKLTREMNREWKKS